jgi:hypothetical protein
MNEIKLNSRDVSGVSDSVGNFKDVYERLVVIDEILSSVGGGRDREDFARVMVIKSALEGAMNNFKDGMKNLIPGADAIRRQFWSEEKYSEMKLRGFFDDEPYLKGGAA